jgi:signal transduction histidine kinase
LFVESDENRLVQIMTNLLDNAIKFTSNGKITFGVHIIEHNRIDFFVSDTGIGIEKEKQSIIFERFSQAHESISNKFGGTGLGLSIVQKIIEIMGGEIRVDSEPGKGSVFSFYVLTPSTVVV